jgi:PadR family transcriptional regulator PadR
MAESLDVQLKKGVLDLCVLAVLSRGESYAYEIAQQLTEQIGMGEGTIYPLMRRLQNDGLVATYLVESSAGPSRKYYKLTKAGKAAYRKQKAVWTEFARAVDEICEDQSRDPSDVHRRSA